jgi:hypothetical protein
MAASTFGYAAAWKLRWLRSNRSSWNLFVGPQIDLNPANVILHTILVHSNGFITGVTSGTKEDSQDEFKGPLW